MVTTTGKLKPRSFEFIHGYVQVRHWLWGILGIGALLRLVTLGRQSLWLDEAISFWYVNRPWPELAANLSEHSRPLYFVFLHLMVSMGGDEWLLRLPSALAGIASIALIYVIGAECFDRKTGLVAALILALSPLHIWYAQEARFYALLVALVLAAILFAVRALRTRGWVNWVLFGVFEGLALWTETGAIWIVLGVNAFALLWLVNLWRTGRLKGWSVSQGIALIIYLPVLVDFTEAMSGTNTFWIPPSTLTILARTLADFLGSFMRTPVESRLIALVGLLALMAGGTAIWREIRKSGRGGRERYLFLVCWFVIPVGLSFIISQPYVRLWIVSLIFGERPSVFLTRNLMAASPALFILLARGLVLARKQAAAAILVALVGLSGYAYLGNTLPDRKEDYRSAALVVMSQAQPGDLVVFAPPYLETPFAYYYFPFGGVHANGVERPEIEDGVIQDGVDPAKQGQVYAEPSQAFEDHRRIWLIANQNIYQPDTEGTQAALQAWGRITGQWELADLTVTLYENGMASSPGGY